MNKQFLDTFQVPLPFLFTYDMFDIKWSQGDTEKKRGRERVVVISLH